MKVDWRWKVEVDIVEVEVVGERWEVEVEVEGERWKQR